MTSIRRFVAALRRGRTASVASGTSLALVAGVLVVLAFRAEGTTTVESTLNDGSVWVSRTDDGGQVARLNTVTEQLDTVLSTGGVEALYQFEDFVAVRAGDLLTMVDVARGTTIDPAVSLPEDVDVAAGGGRLAVHERTDKGRLWMVDAAEAASFDASRPADAVVGEAALVDVSDDGTVVVARPRKARVEVTTYAPGPDGQSSSVEVEVEGELRAVSSAADVPVVLVETSSDSSTVAVPGRPELTLDIAWEDVRLMKPSAAGAAVHVATPFDLWSTSGDEWTRTSEGHRGPAARPTVLAGYVHAAWRERGDGAYVRLPHTTRHDATKVIVKGLSGVPLGSPDPLEFRVNREQIVLNDLRTGDAYPVQQDPPRHVEPEEWLLRERSNQAKPTDPTEGDPTARENVAPTAVDDDLGARTGGATILPVLTNDSDPNGDVLTIQGSPSVDGVVSEVSVVGKGTQLQVTPDRPGTATITYTVSDGRGKTDTADVTLTVTDANSATNAAPTLYPGLEDFRTSTTSLSVSAGHTSSKYVLGDWIDPDGDDLVLALSARDQPEGLDVSVRPDGVVTITAEPGQERRETVHLEVGDGEAVSELPLPVAVLPEDEPGVEAVADQVSGTVGEPFTLDVAANDRTADGSELDVEVGEVTEGPQGLTTSTDDTTVTFRALEAGDYYVGYTASSGDSSDEATIRVAVVDADDGGAGGAPVAVKDTGQVRPGGSTVVDLLANDFDPDDDVLVVTRLRPSPAAEEAGVKASIRRNSLAFVESAGELEESVDLTYTVSDGRRTDEGTLTISPVKDQANRPPVAEDDPVSMRTGTVTTIDVLDNDQDLDGDRLELVARDATEMASSAGSRPWDDGRLFVSGRLLKVRAPSTPGEYRAVYVVTDGVGAQASATVVLTVTEPGEENQAPTPAPVVARSVVGQTTRIDLDLGRADQDGDAVSVRSISAPPSRGRIVRTGLDWVDYEATRPGGDAFTVEVTDPRGATAGLDVTVGVADRGPNNPPVALDDEIVVKPGTRLDYQVTANDTDPDGDAVTLTEAFSAPSAGEVTHDGRRGTIAVRAPGNGQQIAVGYGIVDRRGGQSGARLTVRSSDDAELKHPVVQDDAAEMAMIAAAIDRGTVDVAVLDNDSDPDGRRADLRIVEADRGAEVVRVKGQDVLRIELAKASRAVSYAVQDLDDNIAYGFVYVTGTDDLVPTLIDEEVPLQVTQGQPSTAALADFIRVGPGLAPLLASTIHLPDGVTAAKDLRSVTLELAEPGPTQVELDVTDDPGRDRSRPSTSVAVPVDVRAEEGGAAPTLEGGELKIAAGGEVTVDLATLAESRTTRGEKDLTFGAIAPRGSGISADVDGSELVLKADDGVRVPSTAEVRIAAQDGDRAAEPETLAVTVVKHAEPVLSIPREIVIDGKQNNDTEIYDVTEYVGSPLDGPQLEVRLGDAPDGVQPRGSQIQVTPRNGVGRTVVPFEVTDDPDDPTRWVKSQLIVITAVAPDAPAQPQVSDVQSGSVTLSWAAPDDHGSPIVRYEVEGVGEPCLQTTCVIDGLTTGSERTFRVKAVNREGQESEWSPSSAPVTPQDVPDIMSAPTVAQDPKGGKMDGRLTLSWTPPADNGSPITGYEIQYHGEVKRVGGNLTTTTLEGLTNGTPYSFAIRAVNAVGEADRFSVPSSPVKPMGPPGNVATLQAQTPKSGAGGGGEVELSWTPADPNGDDRPVSYEVTWNGGGESGSSPSTKTSMVAPVENSDRPYTFSVVAINRAGTSAAPATAQANVYDQPAAVTSLREVDEGDGSARIGFAPGAPGLPIDHYEIRATPQGGGAPVTTSSPSAGEVTINGLRNGSEYEVVVTPVGRHAAAGEIRGKEAVVGELARPFGPPPPPTKVAMPQGDHYAVTLRGSAGSNGRPSKVEFVETGQETATLPVEQGGTERCAMARTTSQGRTESSPRLSSAEVRICDFSLARDVEIRLVAIGRSHGACSANCYWVNVHVSGFRPNSRQAADLALNGNSDWCEGARPCDDPRGFNVGSNGSGSLERYYYFNRNLGTPSARVDGVPD